RLGLVLVGGKTDSFAYYSTVKPRTCSIHLQRNRPGYRKWVDNGNTTRINLERGLVAIEHREGEYRLAFQDIDRERYCGVEGTINGTLTIRRGSERCELAGIMDAGVPLGWAPVQREQAGGAEPEPQPRDRATQRRIIPSVPAWPSAGN
ncbi:MAG: hypothetical protein V4637_21145, partial [Pseudomonadota bacterium]